MRVLVRALTLSLVIGLNGCQQNPPQNNSNVPWLSGNPAAPAAPSGSDLSLPQLAELMKRQAETSRLSQQQQDELSRLTQLFREQQQTELAQRQQKTEDRFRELQEQSQLVEQQRRELEQMDELRRRTLELDANNRELHSQLAQSHLQKRLLEDQSKLLKQQLDDAGQKLAQASQDRQFADQQMSQMNDQVSALQASIQKRSGATIRANSSPRQNLEAIQIAGVTVRQDGDVVRIELPSDQLFAPQTATLTQQAQPVLDQVAVAVGQHYSRQMIGVESHTDNAPVNPSVWRSNHQLSAAQAMAVFDYLSSRHRFGERQLFVLGHGPNYPIASNATPSGQQRNRRVEVVIYPETVDHQ
ncbi:MAG: OmpA family protein [Planctomycetales bacterium]|nr:OmpA family protein [Planctomycetales bacterium]